jgi:hypothetical protein
MAFPVIESTATSNTPSPANNHVITLPATINAAAAENPGAYTIDSNAGAVVSTLAVRGVITDIAGRIPLGLRKPR